MYIIWYLVNLNTVDEYCGGTEVRFKILNNDKDSITSNNKNHSKNHQFEYVHDLVSNIYT